MAFAALTIDLNAKLASFEQDMKRANSSLDTLNKRANLVGEGFKAAFGAAGALLSVGALSAIAKSSIDAADNLNDLSTKLGVSVETLAGFKLAAEQSGTSLEGVGTGISKLTKSIGEAEGGNTKLAEALQQLGVTARDPKEAFFQLADAVQKTTDPAQRAALLSQVLGKSYSDLVPLLSQGSDALRQSAKDSETFAQSMAKLAPDADNFNDQLAQMQINSAGFAAKILSDVLPAMNSFLKAMRDGQHAGLGFMESIKIDIGINKPIEQYAVWLSEVNKRQDIANQRLKQGGKNSAEYKDALSALTVAQQKMATYAGLIPTVGAKSAPASKSEVIATPAVKSTSRATKSTTDPLASILSGTDIAKAAEYTKLLSLIDSRFDGGRKNVELYQQSIAVLNEKFGKTQQDIFNGSFSSADNKTVDFIKQQQDAINSLNAEMAGDGVKAAADYDAALASLLSNTDAAKTTAFTASIDTLNSAFFNGVISASQYDQAIQQLTSGAEAAKPALSEMDEFAKSAARNIQTSMADFLFDPFKDGLDGMLAGFGKTLQRMVADAVAADLAKRIFGSLGGGTGDGWLGAAMALFSANGNVFENGNHVTAFAKGGILGPMGGVLNQPTMFAMGGGIGIAGEAGSEAIMPLKRGRDGKMGVASSGGSRMPNITVVVQGGQSAPDVRRSAGQGAREALSMINSAQRYV